VRREHIAQLGSDFRGVTGLPPAGDDEQLVRDLIALEIDAAEQYARWIDRHWLDAEIATARLLHARVTRIAATLTLGPARAAALRERIELGLVPAQPDAVRDRRSGRARGRRQARARARRQSVPDRSLAYFQNQRREVGPDLDLDGLAASHEQVLRFTEPAVRRVRRRIELPMCARAGTYVVDLIGNGMSSRAVIHKGRLRQMMRIGPRVTP